MTRFGVQIMEIGISCGNMMTTLLMVMIVVEMMIQVTLKEGLMGVMMTTDTMMMIEVKTSGGQIMQQHCCLTTRDSLALAGTRLGY